MTRTTKAVALLWLLMAACFAPALAHQQKAGLSRVVFNDRAGTLEVTHRFILHDAEHAVARLFGKNADIHNDADTKRRFARHVIDNFSLKIDDEPVELDVVGAEVDGKHFWVYQEAPLPRTANSLTVRQSALTALWADQENLVNVEGRGPVQSRRFQQGEGAKRIELPPQTKPAGN